MRTPQQRVHSLVHAASSCHSQLRLAACMPCKSAYTPITGHGTEDIARQDSCSGMSAWPARSALVDSHQPCIMQQWTALLLCMTVICRGWRAD